VARQAAEESIHVNEGKCGSRAKLGASCVASIAAQKGDETACTGPVEYSEAAVAVEAEVGPTSHHVLGHRKSELPSIYQVFYVMICCSILMLFRMRRSELELWRKSSGDET
jgi:hypothetical protein